MSKRQGSARLSIAHLMPAAAMATIALLSPSAPAQAQWLVGGEASATVPMDGWANEAFGVGGSLSVSGFRAITPWFAAGVRLRGGYLSDAADPGLLGVADPGAGSVFLAGASVRFQLPFCMSERADGKVQLACGPFLEGTGGLGVTGEDPRPGIELGIGWMFAIGSVSLGPTIRYHQLIQPDGAENVVPNDDARLLLFGVEVALDLTPEEAPPAPPPGPSDRDQDGILDPVDQCPDDPEDRDGFEDEDGCPDADNDQDGILDPVDQCPLEAEDIDGFMDEDGCPEPDNDGDGVLDQNDRCPDGMEVINGIDDDDGCPDEGLIEMVEDRIVLDERVLFSTDHWVVRPGAYPVLRAIVELWRQHQEWARVSIEGHADYRGDDEYNVELSRRRAQAVADVLAELGMPASMMNVVGYGSSRPRVVGYGTRAMQRNRRVEFVVLDAGAESTLSAPESSAPAVPVEEQSPPPSVDQPGAESSTDDQAGAEEPDAMDERDASEEAGSTEEAGSAGEAGP